MKQITTILATLLFSIFTANAKIKIIDIKQTLLEAKTIRTIIVIGYKDSVMLYRFLYSNDTLSINCVAKFYTEPIRQSLIDKKTMAKTDLAGKWPDAGQEVLIVITLFHKVSLFAIKTGNDYRFWDPNSQPYVKSYFLVPNETPYKPLDNCKDQAQNEFPASYTCMDGCLVAAVGLSRLKERD